MARPPQSSKPLSFHPLLKLAIEPEQPVYRQITEGLRNLIVSKALPPGMRLPTIKVLAKEWNTNYFTAQNGIVPLINEGLLESRPGRGTFVALNQKIKAIGIYDGGNFWNLSDGVFYQSLSVALCKELEERGIEVKLFIDSRPPRQQTTPFKPLREAIENRSVNGVITLTLGESNYAWVEKLSLPYSVLSSHGHAHCVSLDIRHFIKSSLQRMSARGCRNVGMITASSRNEPLEDYFISYAKTLGLSTSDAWISTIPQSMRNSEEFGYEAFKRMWNQSQRPDGLLVYPDNIGRGVMTTVLTENVRVPDELCLVMHRVEETPFFSPLAVDWQLVSTTKTAKALIDLVQRQVEGMPFKAVQLKTELKPACVVS